MCFHKQVVEHCLADRVVRRHVRRKTAQCEVIIQRITHIIDVLKGDAGKDQYQTSLFKANIIDWVWGNQRRHVHCITDPPGVHMYRLVRHRSRNGVLVPVYKCVRGSNSLEGFHQHLKHMIPGKCIGHHNFIIYIYI